MATLEMVEKLRQRANVSYDEAKAALEASGDDILEAVIYLERQGKVNPPTGGGYYSTRQAGLSVHQGGSGDYVGESPKGESFGDLMRRFWNWVKKVVHKGNTNHFEVWRGEERFISVPVTVLVLLLALCIWVTLPLLVVGLFLGCKYHFRGPELGESSVNNVMDSASKVADDLKSEVKNANKEYKERHDQDNQ